MTGLGERTARALHSHLIETGLTAHVVPVRVAFPRDALQFFFDGAFFRSGDARRLNTNGLLFECT